MLSCTDRHGHDFGVRIGDTLRLPDPGMLGRPGSDRWLINRTWDVVAFAGGKHRHCAIIRRRHDGHTQRFALHWIAIYANPQARNRDLRQSIYNARYRRDRRIQKRAA